MCDTSFRMSTHCSFTKQPDPEDDVENSKERGKNSPSPRSTDTTPSPFPCNTLVTWIRLWLLVNHLVLDPR